MTTNVMGIHWKHLAEALPMSIKAGAINRTIDYLIDEFHKMIIITELLIIDYLISVSVILPYLPLVFRHLNSLTHFI